MNFSATTAKASLISHRSMSSIVRPALASTLRAAGTGALSISVGLSPMLAMATTRARGFRPLALA
jgi:ABC-type nitrate/sulfonate/bicarbonate transport system substrate-binding protein